MAQMRLRLSAYCDESRVEYVEYFEYVEYTTYESLRVTYACSPAQPTRYPKMAIYSHRFSVARFSLFPSFPSSTTITNP